MDKSKSWDETARELGDDISALTNVQSWALGLSQMQLNDGQEANGNATHEQVIMLARVMRHLVEVRELLHMLQGESGS